MIPALRRVAPFAFCLAGLVTGHGPIVLSGFARIQNDQGDSRLNQYLMEHGYRWLRRLAIDRSFWDPPFFYPAQNIAAYADSMLGAGPVYWLWRAVGFSPDTAFQLWMLSVSALNFAAAYWMLRRPMKRDVLASCAGAFLFAFAASRINQTMHHQLFPHFYSPLAVGALVIALRRESPRQTRLGLFGFAVCCALQIYGGVYLGWFLGLGLLVAAVAALAVREWRQAVLALAREYWRSALGAAATGAAVVSWAAIHYARAGATTGGTQWSEVLTMLPRGPSWLNLGYASWLYGWMSSTALFKDIPMEHEQRLGVGLVTTAMVIAGFALKPRGEERRSMMGWILAAGVLLSTLYWAEVSGWRLIFAAMPGANAIRAVCRIGIALLLPASVGVARWVTWLGERAWGKWAALACAAVVVAEQGETTPAYEKAQNRAEIAAVAQQIDPAHCRAFLYSPLQGQRPSYVYHLDAMWAGLFTGVPTLNGYSRTGPPGWGINEVNVSSEEDEANVRNTLDAWERFSGLGSDGVCWVRFPVRDAPDQAEFVRQSAPDEMFAKQPYELSVTFRNIGTSTWSPGDQFNLGSQAPQDSKVWLPGARVPLPGPVPPGQEVTFTFRVTAPESPGPYALRHRMVHEMVNWFGEFTPPFLVKVRPAPEAQAPDAGP